MRLLRRFVGLNQLEPKKIQQNRFHLQKRQKKNIDLAASLPKDQSLLNLSLAQLQTKPCKERFGTFVSRCSDRFHQQLKFLADINISEARQFNREGIPYTAKDQINVQDLVTTCGYSNGITPSHQNAEIVDILSQHGCVPFAHSNIPQGLLNIQSANNVYGRSINPYKRGFISGGSSGGDAVAVATKCAAFAVCTDSAGSARIPAAFSGVVGFKPTGSKRLSIKGRVGVTKQQGPSFSDVDTSLGFITRSVDDLEWLCSKTLGKSIEPNPYIYCEWDSQKYQNAKTKKLKVGYMIQDHQMKCAPAIKNSITESCQYLEKSGHQVTKFEFSQLYKFRNFFFQLLENNNFFAAMAATLGEEDENPQSWWIYERARYGKLGNLIRKILAGSINEQREVYKNFDIEHSSGSLLKAIAEKNYVKQKFIAQWNKQKMDILITPVMPFTALQSNSNQFLINQLTFCCFQNILEMPSGSLPTRFVRQEQTQYNDNGFYGLKAAKSIKASQGLPIGIQITSSHMQDQLCLGAMWQLQQHYGKMASPKKWI